MPPRSKLVFHRRDRVQAIICRLFVFGDVVINCAYVKVILHFRLLSVPILRPFGGPILRAI